MSIFIPASPPDTGMSDPSSNPTFDLEDLIDPELLDSPTNQGCANDTTLAESGVPVEQPGAANNEHDLGRLTEYAGLDEFDLYNLLTDLDGSYDEHGNWHQTPSSTVQNSIPSQQAPVLDNFANGTGHELQQHGGANQWMFEQQHDAAQTSGAMSQQQSPSPYSVRHESDHLAGQYGSPGGWAQNRQAPQQPASNERYQQWPERQSYAQQYQQRLQKHRGSIQNFQNQQRLQQHQGNIQNFQHQHEYRQALSEPQSWQHSPQPDRGQIGSGDRAGYPINNADLSYGTPSQDPNLRSQPQHQTPGMAPQNAGDMFLTAPQPGMDFANMEFDWDEWTVGMTQDTPTEQNSPQQTSMDGPYFVNGAAQMPAQSQEGIAGPSHVNMQMLDNLFDGQDSDAAASPQPEHFHHSPRPTTRRPRGRGKERATSASATGENPECLDCGKRYRTTKSPGRCNRCGDKYERKIAQPRTYGLDPSVPDLAAAKRLIFPPVRRRHIQDDDFDYARVMHNEDRYLERLLHAVNVVQTANGGDDSDWKARQQKTFNEKAKLEPGYTNAHVTARLRALFGEAVSFHNGGESSIYAAGGDNAGYPDSLRPFSERMNMICNALENNKRIVMDVIEGRGVQAFVCNPKKYDDRKASNNFCNVKKKKMMDKGKELEGEDDSPAGPSRSTRARNTTETRQDTPDSVVSSIENSPAGPGKKRRRTQRRQQAASPSPMADDEGSVYSPDEPSDAEYQPPVNQNYGSGRSRTADWVHGRRGR